MDTIVFNPDRADKLDLTHKKPKRVLAHWNRKVREDDRCSCNATEPIACAFCRRKHAKDETPW